MCVTVHIDKSSIHLSGILRLKMRLAHSVLIEKCVYHVFTVYIINIKNIYLNT